MSPFTMGQTIWFRCIHIYIEIVVANCAIIEAKFSGRLWYSECKNKAADQDYIGRDAGHDDSILCCVCLCDHLIVVFGMS